MKAIAHSCPSLGSAEVEAAQATISSGFVGHGPRARELEALLAAATGKRFAFAVSSGFHALVLSLRILDLPTGQCGWDSGIDVREPCRRSPDGRISTDVD